MDAVEQLDPACRRHGQVQEALDDVECRHGRLVLLQVRTNLLCRRFGRLAGNLQEGEHYEGEMPLKLFLCLLQLHLRGGHFLPVECMDGLDDRSPYFVFNLHNVLNA